MAVGISTPNVANPVLDWLRGVTPPTVDELAVKLHTGDPGAAGTSNPSAVTTRMIATMNAASGGSISLNTISGSWSMTATETVSHISVWDDETAGVFLFSAALITPRNVVSGDTLTLTTLTVGHTPLAS